ncbi:MAG TPA: Xaa-Pro peptidase family protein [Acidimicrobiales bacterium]|nr:Xaa-Pro peptidase family protein [Acidimicrobiales bacterium]
MTTATGAPARLTPMDVAGRIDRLRSALAQAGVEALLVTNLTNVRYLTGFSGSAAHLMVGPDDALLATDGRYRIQAEEELSSAGARAGVFVGRVAEQRQALMAAGTGVGRLGLEAASVSWARQRELAAEWFPGAEVVPTEGLVEELRRRKDPGEIARVAEAARLTDHALATVVSQMAVGVTEAEVALALDSELRRLGASGSAFDTIVAAGPNSAKPHARPSARPVAERELVVVDVGAVVDGYRSDMTRTFCLGEPPPLLRTVVEAVAESQRAGVAAVRAGRPAAEVDTACREVIAAAGWGDAFVHGTGHGVGLDIHEAPSVAATSGDTLAAAHVVTVEPGVYLPDQGGARIEDTVVVTDDGCIPLTNAPKDLVIE